MNKKVSIIVPCYNGERFINRCLNSIINQTYKNIEVVIVDDGSTDNSKALIDIWFHKFTKESMKLVYVYQPNKGLGGAINTGLKHITGEYLTLLDIDDVFMPTSVEERVKFLDNHSEEYSIVRTNGYYVSEYDIDTHKRLFVTEEFEKKSEHIFEDLLRGKTNNWSGSYMVRVKLLFEFYNDKNIYESRYGQNLQLLLPLSYKHKVGFIDKPLMKYVKQENSLSQIKAKSNAIKKEIENQNGYKDIKEYLLNIIVEKEEIQYFTNITEEVYSRMFMYLYLESSETVKAKSYYDILKTLNKLTLEDKIIYLNYQENYLAKVKILLFLPKRIVYKFRRVVFR